jgi:hypothetical protein
LMRESLAALILGLDGMVLRAHEHKLGRL